MPNLSDLFKKKAINVNFISRINWLSFGCTKFAFCNIGIIFVSLPNSNHISVFIAYEYFHYRIVTHIKTNKLASLVMAAFH